MNLKPLLITLLLIITLNADENAPLNFYEDAKQEKWNFSANHKLRLQVTDKESNVQSKFVTGSYWEIEYIFNKTTFKKFFIKKVREKIKSYGGTVTFFDSDFVHCSIPIGEKLYWATVTYQKSRYMVKIVENKNIKLVQLDNSKKNQHFEWHKMIPKVLGYRIVDNRSSHKRYTKQKIAKKILVGEYWFLRFRKKSSAESISKSDLMVGFKDELRRIKGRKIDENSDEGMIIFVVDDTYGVLRVSEDGFTLEMIDKSNFKESIDVKSLNNSNITLYGLLFRSGKAKLSNDEGTKSVLLKIQTMMESSDDLVIEIQGHTDNVGDAYKNKILSLARAESVKRALVKKGIDPKRLKTKGFGETKPIGNNAVDEGRAKNRRVELRKVEGKISLNIKHFPPLEGYEREIRSFESGKISDKNGFQAKGREVRGEYNLIQKKSSFSTLEIMKNYESIIVKMKGKIVSRREDKLYFIFNEKISGRLSVFDEYYYISLIYKKGAKQ